MIDSIYGGEVLDIRAENDLRNWVSWIDPNIQVSKEMLVLKTIHLLQIRLKQKQ